jgi:hypothetical protein
MKTLLFCLALLFFAFPVEAQWLFWGQKYCWGCRRYMNLDLAGYEGICYGYIDNINYPDVYYLPRNYFFNYCPPCRYYIYDSQYLKNCIHYTNQKMYFNRAAE